MTAGGNRANVVALNNPQAAQCRAAKIVCLLQYRVEYRREVAGRGIDDAEYLGGRGLLLQGLAGLGDEPRILHSNHRLRREVLQQRDLLVGERPDFGAIGGNVAEQLAVLPERY